MGSLESSLIARVRSTARCFLVFMRSRQARWFAPPKNMLIVLEKEELYHLNPKMAMSTMPAQTVPST